MTTHRKAKPDFLHANSRWAQEYASSTREGVDLYDDAGVPRLVLRGWPCRGKMIMAFGPSYPQKGKEGKVA